MSDYLEEKFLKAVLNGEAFPTLSSLWLALALTAVFTDSSYASEVSGGGYARVQLTAAFTVADAGGGQWQGKNTSGISYEATSDWGSPPTDRVVGWGLLDAAMSGNLILHGPLDDPVAVYGGQVFTFDPLTLVIEAQ